jgi:hypothetical protein
MVRCVLLKFYSSPTEMSYQKPIKEKICKVCGILKPINSFPIAQVYKKTGVISTRPMCKDCYSDYCHKQRLQRVDKIKEYNQTPVAKNARKRYRDTHKEESRQYQIDHWDDIKALARANSKTEKARKTKREYAIRRYRENENIRLYSNLKRRTILALKGIPSVGNSIFDLWGCDLSFMKKHLSSQFTEGMNWGNHSLKGWHIDHILPIDSFDMRDIEQQKKCFHWTNLPPLWAEDNLRKSNKILAA